MLPIALITAVIVIIWGAVLIRLGGLLAACLMVLLLGSCFGHDFFHVGPITSDRLLLCGTFAMFAYLRWCGYFAARPIGTTDLLLMLLMAWLIYSTFSHDWKFAEYLPVSRLLFYYLLPFLMFWIARGIDLDEKRAIWMLGGTTIFGVYLSLTGICEVLQLYSLVFPRYISSPDIWEFYGRARGPYLNPIANGLYMTICMSASLLLYPHLSKKTKPIAAICTLLILVGIYSTLTRSVWLGALLAMGVIGAATIPRRHRKTAVICIVASGLILSPIAWSKLKSFKRDKDISVAEMEESASLRPILAAVAWNILADNPYFGCGLGQYKNVDADYIAQRNFDLPMEKAIPYHQHNVFLSVLVENGILGFAIFLCLLLAIFRDAISLLRNERISLWQRQHGLLVLVLLAVYLANGMFHELSIIPMVNMLVFFLVGICRNLCAQRSKVGLHVDVVQYLRNRLLPHRALPT